MKILSVFRRLALFVSLVLLLSGCVPGTFESIATTLFIYEKDLDSSNKHNIELLVEQYVNELADSPCRSDQVRPIDPIVQQLKDHRYTGLEKVVSRLHDIASNKANSEGVRASALYYQSVIYAMSHNPNRILAVSRLKELKQSYPNHYECLFQSSEWQDRMITKYLLLPGQTLEEFKAEFKTY
ncbi:MAG: hypothetical protein CSA50_08665 [Gammaproteobacteria bacterium]|nr:MAG: hypothetical protein CSA50_08665 [Gammaproteobacteria bacterium]